jgi:hypothetical protein
MASEGLSQVVDHLELFLECIFGNLWADLTHQLCYFLGNILGSFCFCTFEHTRVTCCDCQNWTAVLLTFLQLSLVQIGHPF